MKKNAVENPSASYWISEKTDEKLHFYQTYLSSVRQTNSSDVRKLHAALSAAPVSEERPCETKTARFRRALSARKNDTDEDGLSMGPVTKVWKSESS